ncbi:indoleacetamide hydrolase [Rhizobium sp. 16-449-1b]|uniref:indoleacetamide hydrolase n=1 Tax=Rhizobium sp. 16-449-1b TaxID=2819989 RepID=UPI001ADAF06D|nr:indoleacetamide hydrolase [Rhizobium sp. 16-449-1b]MBO9195984.1 indoleacetamide hydrolase [Rhizobium sp. 16-449-1b]
MELFDLGLTQSVAAIRDGDITSEQLVGSLLSRSRDQQGLNAFVSLDPERILNAAREADRVKAAGHNLGPLHGVPIALKDNIDAVGYTTTAGTPVLREHRPRVDAPVVEALLYAGAIVFGKVGMHELALGITSNNKAFGAVRNPYDMDRVPGGSSGGSGAAVAARIVPASIGTDTGGSVRVPASFCGVTGYRPTAGRWPGGGIVPISGTRDTPGPIARSVEDLYLLDAVVTGDRSLPPYRSLRDVRLGVPRGHFWQDLDYETGRLCEETLAKLERAGVTFIEVDLHRVAELDASAGFTVALHEMPGAIDSYLASQGLNFSFDRVARQASSPDVAAVVKAVADKSGAVPKAAYEAAIRGDRPKLVQAYQDCFSRNGLDAVVFPTTPLPAPLIGQDNFVVLNGRALPTFSTVVRNTGPGSLAGIPGVSLPVGFTKDGLPVGLALDSVSGSDRLLLAVAAAIERAIET